ncbi:RING1 and YY1-binding protein-like isoform X2 [Branchiostoma floridae]|uniref:RING1 and YY1-binding protein-like isoform X2 n=1 Tax=Branchiostoma floridae TaxID=7739 RepID=A0A9J7LA24_BRAFL|nr:RING1 and YY1-binding protein-like isoform X2 [Branchiostoma floridae]
MTDKGEQRRSPNRPKRDKKAEAEGYWECSVCTFRNNAEAFKCSMCDVRKGTSTRKPRLNSQLVAQQVAQQFNPPQPKPPKREREKGEKERENGVSSTSTSPNSSATVSVSSNNTTTGVSGGMGKKKEHSVSHTSPTNTSSNKKMKYMPRLKNVDRSTATHMAVTVNNVTVIITDYKEKAPKSSSASSSISSEPPSTVTSDTPSTNSTVAMAVNPQESPTSQQNGDVAAREQT